MIFNEESSLSFDLGLVSSGIAHHQQDKDVYRLCVKADALRIKSFFSESIDMYSQALEIEHDNFDALLGIGLAHKKMGSYKDSVFYFKKAIKTKPFEKRPRIELSECYLVFGETEKARAELEKFLKIYPDDIEGWMALAKTFENQFKFRKTEEICEKIKTQNPYQINVKEEMASFYLRIQNYDRAVKIFYEIIRQNNSFSRAYLGLAISLDFLKERSKALRYYKKYLELKPHSSKSEDVKKRIMSLRQISFGKSASANSVKKTHLKIVEGLS